MWHLSMADSTTTTARDAVPEVDHSLSWWQERQLPFLAATENSGVVLVVGGSDGSAALRCSVILPLLLLQHDWAPQRVHRHQPQTHILVALETRTAAESAAAAAREWGGGRYASSISTHKSTISSSTQNSSSPPRVVYLTTRQLLQRILQQPLLSNCCVVALEVSLQHGFSTELLLPLLRKVRRKKPALRVLLLLPPAAVQPQWTLQLAQFFACNEDAARPDAAIIPYSSVKALEAAAQQQQDFQLRFFTPKSSRWDVKQKEPKARPQQQQKREPSISSSDAGKQAAAEPFTQASGDAESLECSSRNSRTRSSSVSCVSSDEVVVLGVTAGQPRTARGRPAKRKKAKSKDKKLQQRLRKIQKKLKKMNSSSNGAKSSRSRANVNISGFSREQAACIERTDTQADAEPPKRFLYNTSHATEPLFDRNSDDEASLAATARPATELETQGGTTSAPPQEEPPKSREGLSGSRAEGPLLYASLHEESSISKGNFSSVSIISVTPPTKRVAVRYLKNATPNFVGAAAAVVSLLVTASPEAQGGVSHCGSIFVFVPSQEDVTELAEKLQHCLQEVLKQQQQQQPHLQNPPVEVVCLAPDLSPSLAPPSSALRIFISPSLFPPCVSPAVMPIRFVVDCMYTRRSVFDPFLRLHRFCNVPISGALADLRASLAGRYADGGCCYRLCTASAFAATCARGAAAFAAAAATIHREAYGELPASALEDIAPLLLQLKALGVHSLHRLPLLQPPPAAAVAAAAEHLLQLQAVDDGGRITKPLGCMIAQGLLSPELTRLLVISTEQAFGCSVEAAAVCALLGGPPVWQRPALENCGMSLKDPLVGQNRRNASAARQRLALSRALLGSIEGDAVTALNVFNQYYDIESEQGAEEASRWAEKHLVDEQVMWRASKMRRVILNWMQKSGLPLVTCKGDCKPLLRALAAAFCLNVAKKTHDQIYRLFRLPGSASSPPFVIHPSSVLSNCAPPFVVYGQAFVRDGCVYMQQVTAIDPQWLPEVAPHLFTMNSAEFHT